MKPALLTAALASACFVYFAWGIAAHFRRDGPMPAGMLAIGLTSLACFAWFLGSQATKACSLARPWSIADAAAVGLMAGSAALFHWAVAANRARPLTLAFSRDKPCFVQRAGPYAYVRHPFYLSYIVFWIGTAVASGRLAHWFAPGLLTLVYYRAASAEESKFARSSLAAEYGAYQAATGMLLPVPRWRHTA